MPETRFCGVPGIKRNHDSSSVRGTRVNQWLVPSGWRAEGQVVVLVFEVVFVHHHPPPCNAQWLRGFDRIQIELAEVPPEVEHDIESVWPIRPMRPDEGFELVLVTGIQSFQITREDLAGWSGWQFGGRVSA